MTYVTDQTSSELRAHMRRLKKMNGWHEPLADRLFKEVLALDARIAELEASQQREPQEAAERPANFTELWELYSRVGDAHENHGRNHEKTMEARATFHAALMRALSAPQEAGKPAACTTIADCTTPKLCLSVGTCKGYYVMPASVRESAAPVEEAGKVEPVADEPFGWFSAFRDGSEDFMRRTDSQPAPAYEEEPTHCIALYAHPSPQALSDEEIIDLARVASTVNNYSNGRFASAIFEREHAIAFARAILAAAGGSEK